MEEARALAQARARQLQYHSEQQQLLLHQLHQQQQQQRHQQQERMLLLQHLQELKQHHPPPKLDAHCRPPGLLHRPAPNLPPQETPNPNPNPNPKLSPKPIPPPPLQYPNPQQQEGIRPSNPLDLRMAYQDAWRVCHPDFKRPFTNLEDACERLLPYHVVAEYEAEEDDRILDSDTTGQMPSRSQQWDHNIAVKVAEFTATFEKQALAFNMINRKRSMGEFRSEERLMVEQGLLQDERRALLELSAQIESREKAGRDPQGQEAMWRMAAMAQGEQPRAELQVHAEMVVRAPIRANTIRSQGNVQFDRFGAQEQGVNPYEMVNRWGNTAQRDEKEPSKDFLNEDEETENGETGMQGEWHEVGLFDLNTR